ncbi:MAG: HAMP domain-containing histidine kinase [Pelosinus sp.]|nr:HAMP domain-containing histidine kinase [Pelosinus sp.]
MFGATLRKLTLLNLSVFLFLFVTFGMLLYSYVARQLFDDVDVLMLRHIFAIFIVSLLIGTVAISLASYYLARRALIPIKAAWEKQQQFTADASHELRTPLAIIKGNAELMLRHPDRTIAEEGSLISNIIRETLRMNKLIGTLLTLARADAQKAELKLERVSLREILENVIEIFQGLFEEQGIKLVLSTEGQLALYADKERLHQLFIILLDNARKYTVTTGKVSIICYEEAKRIHIQIKDTGCGISAADLPYVFDRFFRGDKARSRESGGSGLGLAIAKWIVDKHGGEIKAESQLGVGTVFYITIPLNL